MVFNRDWHCFQFLSSANSSVFQSSFAIRLWILIQVANYFCVVFSSNSRYIFFRSNFIITFNSSKLNIFAGYVFSLSRIGARAIDDSKRQTRLESRTKKEGGRGIMTVEAAPNPIQRQKGFQPLRISLSISLRIEIFPRNRIDHPRKGVPGIYRSFRFVCGPLSLPSPPSPWGMISHSIPRGIQTPCNLKCDRTSEA